MTAEDILRRVVSALDRARIPYMLTGSFASSFHGAPRATQDIDIVISPSTDQLRTLVKLLPETEYYVDLGAALDAQQQESQFNVIDFATGWKVDLIVRKSRPFSREEFERRTVVDFKGIRLAITTAEDLLIAKLEWAKLGNSQRQVEDAAGILKLRVAEMDRPYLAKWIQELGLKDQWESACRTAGIAP